MSVSKDASGRRSIQVEVEVPAPREDVWRAIATGPGVTAWFVPTQIEEREGGALIFRFGPGMEGSAVVTAEVPSPDVCVARVVQDLVASGDEWDGHLEGMEAGWPFYFRTLQLYVTHFRGESCSPVQVMGLAPGPASTAWEALAEALGLTGAEAGRRIQASDGAPPFGGLAESHGAAVHPHVRFVRLDVPAPGIACLNVYTVGAQVFVMVTLYLYGDPGAEAATRDATLWQTWMDDLFPRGA
jgi:hypothetical protein